MRRKKLLALRAGPLEMLFDPEIGWIRRIRLGRHEVVRAIYGAVRDHHWDTIKPHIEVLDQEVASDHFRLTFKAICQSGDVHFEWIGNLSGEANGTIQFRFEGEARSAFSKNRIGLCLLHPIAECAGKTCRIKHTDGTDTSSKFPSDISPHQPFKDIAMISHTIVPGVEAEVALGGDVFEMEDQRNWTDTSFKTYSTPLDLPYPVQMRRGDKIRQEIRISIKGDISGVSTEAPDTYLMEMDSSMTSEPTDMRLGLGLATPVVPHDQRSIERLKTLDLDHLRVDVYPSRPDWKKQLEAAAQLGAKLGTQLHLAIHFKEEGEEAMARVLDVLPLEGIPVPMVLVFHEDSPTTNATLVDKVQSMLDAKNLSTHLSAGTNTYFAELNRHRESVGDRAFPCYSINPQVHAFDDLSLMETLEAQTSTVESAWQLFSRPIVVSPITLKPRFNPNATAKATKAVTGKLPFQVDPRQSSLFAAAWTLGSLAGLLPNRHVHSLTYYETMGAQGILEHESGSPFSGVFQSIPGGVYPVYHVFRDMAGFSKVSRVESEESGELACIQLVSENQVRVLMANLTPETKEIHIKLESQCVSVRVLESDNVRSAMEEPEVFQSTVDEIVIPNEVLHLILTPYAIATIDLLSQE